MVRAISRTFEKGKGGNHVFLTSLWGEMHFLQLANAIALRLKA